MRVRRVVTRRGRHIRGYFPSKKMKRMVAWESLLERDALLLLELSPGVVAYQEQPEELAYWDGEAIRAHIPDLWASLHDERTLFIEIKPSSELTRPRVKTKYSQIAEQMQAQGLDYRLLTDTAIRQVPLFRTLQTLLYHYNHPASPLPTRSQLAAAFYLTESLPLAQCLERFGPDVTYSLIAQARLYVDLTQPLAPASLVQLPAGERHATIYF
ncbi:TnsA endonuclease N-terminal domain-containing protein [Chromobacterium sp. IIBBL 290-4]|uniref:TnsA endonuclease N-terminal domain-containing protein n=1 Tax=Chromobacterium sp. IIBBL 290-4 TaxID=2953890 RepID=UPI0020B70F7D|nr:TnsA endonuclease N-terminal domain-containing protein [Chromobacterium sp. IIBBL 290-4]UTH75674.1 TnsA endonuclease N-terminal domain-containing protein [Chromobacterium sp. IIBBL 290-4]